MGEAPRHSPLLPSTHTYTTYLSIVTILSSYDRLSYCHSHCHCHFLYLFLYLYLYLFLFLFLCHATPR